MQKRRLYNCGLGYEKVGNECVFFILYNKIVANARYLKNKSKKRETEPLCLLV
jgi:hypothetical protein